jgi:hypothetical protein
MYFALEVPDGLEQVLPETDEVAQMLESLVSTWDAEVERARATEAEVSTTPAPAGRAAPDPSEVHAELEALKRSHRALVQTLERSISDLEALHEKTVGLVRLVSDVTRPTSDSALCLTALGPTEFPATDETDVIDQTNREALATLDARSRWLPRRRRGNRGGPVPC